MAALKQLDDWPRTPMLLLSLAWPSADLAELRKEIAMLRLAIRRNGQAAAK